MRAIRPEQYHITLAYYGLVDPGQLDVLATNVHVEAGSTASFSLLAEGAGTFRDHQLVWVGVGGNVEELGQLRTRLLRATSEIGATAKQREGYLFKEFTPHITVATSAVRDRTLSERLVSDLVGAGDLARFDVAEVVLFQDAGSGYQVLRTVEVGA